MMNSQCLRRDDPGMWLRVLTFAGVLLAGPILAQAAPPQGGNAVGKKTPAAAAAVSTAQENPRLVEWPGMYWEGHLNPHMREKPEWYATAEAVRIADNVLLYQCNGTSKLFRHSIIPVFLLKSRFFGRFAAVLKFHPRDYTGARGGELPG